MKRTTIFIPEQLERDLQLYAERHGRPVASIVREAVAAYIVPRSDGTLLPSFTGAFDSGHTDTASRHEDLLFGTLAPHGSGDTGSATRGRRPRARSGRPGAAGTRRSPTTRRAKKR